MFLIAALVLTLFGGKLLVSGFDFGQVVNFLNNAGDKADNVIGQAGATAKNVLEFSVYNLGGENFMNSRSVKALLPSTIFNGPCTSVLRTSAGMAADFADWARTGVSGVILAATDFRKSEFGTKFLGLGQLAPASS